VRDISGACHVGQVDDGELAALLLHTIHHAQHTSKTRVDMPNRESPSVSLHYTKHGKLSRVDTSLDDHDLAPILEQIELTLVASPVRRIYRAIALAAVPVKGTWACDLFTLTTPPANAPSPQQVMGDYALIIEFPYDETESFVLNTHRIEQRRRQYELILSLFLPRLNTRPRSVTQRWGVVIGAPLIGFPEIEWFQETYAIEGFEARADELTPVSEPLMPLVSDAEFYSRRGISVDSVFDVPESLETWVRHFASRSDATKERFLRSAFWLRHAHDVYLLSASAALISAVQAVEALVSPVHGRPCPSCGLVGGGGPTATFKELLAQHAPTHDRDLIRARTRLYQTRSKLTHGQDLLSSDAELGFGWSGPQEPFERNDLEMATRVARIAAINWLLLQP
jgi:hypothetical protein